jgi:PleD family two-component response regulator
MDELTGVKKKILLADDDVYISRAYTFALTKAGFEVINAANGDEVLEKAKSNPPSLILLDQMMPVKNGFETLEILKSDETLKHIPVIFFSNLEQESDVEKAKQLGVVDYVVKSEITMKDVVEKVKKYSSA